MVFGLFRHRHTGYGRRRIPGDIGKDKMINLRLSKLSFGFILVMAILGAAFFSILVHEAVHVIQIDDVEGICLDFSADTFMRVYGNGDPIAFMEAWALAINALALVFLMAMVIWIMFYKG